MTQNRNENWLNSFMDSGFAVEDHFASQAELKSFNEEFLHLQKSGRFHRAGVGRGNNHQVYDQLRRDEVAWVEPHGIMKEKLERVRQQLNESAFLGLWDFEGHFASYAPGGFYRKHLDRFSDSDLRTVSFVLYLNESWDSEWGGELVLHFSHGPRKILPSPGRLVLFLSATTWHEVLPAQRERRSFTGWFRVREVNAIRCS